MVNGTVDEYKFFYKNKIKNNIVKLIIGKDILIINKYL
jgi:hypothetical protein